MQTFRQYCTEKWYEHVDEVTAWSKQQPNYDSREYFARHKWTLKQWYVEEFAQQNARAIQKSIKASMKRGNL